MEEELKLDQAVPTLTFEPIYRDKKRSAQSQSQIYEEEAIC